MREPTKRDKRNRTGRAKTKGSGIPATKDVVSLCLHSMSHVSTGGMHQKGIHDLTRPSGINQTKPPRCEYTPTPRRTTTTLTASHCHTRAHREALRPMSAKTLPPSSLRSFGHLATLLDEILEAVACSVQRTILITPASTTTASREPHNFDMAPPRTRSSIVARLAQAFKGMGKWRIAPVDCISMAFMVTGIVRPCCAIPFFV